MFCMMIQLLLGGRCCSRTQFDWPEDFRPHWEEFGKGRVDSGRYATRITYRDHVRPLALKILERKLGRSRPVFGKDDAPSKG